MCFRSSSRLSKLALDSGMTAYDDGGADMLGSCVVK